MVDRIRIRHCVPGRLRVTIARLRRRGATGRAVALRLSELAQVRSVRFRPATGSLIIQHEIVHCEPGSSERRLVEEIRRLLDATVRPEGSLPAARPRRRLKSLPPELVGHLVNAIGLTLFMGWIVLRRLVTSAPLAQRPTSLAGIVASVGGIPLVRRAWRELREGRPVGLFPFLAAACALAIATGAVLTALEIIWVLAIGLFLEGFVTERARRAIRDVLEVVPDRTFVVVDGVEVQVPVRSLRSGQVVVVRSGERVPVDGAVVAGEALLDEAHITGRAVAELRREGDAVFAGTTVQDGRIRVRIERLGDETYLSRVTQLVEEALSQPSQAEKKADELATRLLRLGGAMTLATLVFTRNMTRALTVMLVWACPCATVLAASTAVAAAVANAARRQILIKGGIHLEQAGSIDCFCFDKTGTVTASVPRVVDVVSCRPETSPRDLLALASAAEAKSPHAVARAVRESAEERGIAPSGDVVAWDTFIGRGVRAERSGGHVLVGSRRFMAEQGVDVEVADHEARRFLKAGHSLLYVAEGRALGGLIVVGNDVRPRLAEVLDWLRRDGVRELYLLSGDAEPSVRETARVLGFDRHECEMLPEEKARRIDALIEQGRRVLMIGDGVNDALALSRSTVGVALGTGGSEVAIEAADVALVTDRLTDLVVLRQLSHQTLRVVEQNFWLANSTNILGAVLGFVGLLSPVLGGLVHVGHSLGILANSSRLVRWKPAGLPDGAHTPRPATLSGSKVSRENAEHD